MIAKCLKNENEQSMQLFSEMFFNCTYNKKEIENEPVQEELEENLETSEPEEETIDEENVEEEIIGEQFSKDQDATIDIDEALNDLMNTKQYDVNKDEDEL